MLGYPTQNPIWEIPSRKSKNIFLENFPAQTLLLFLYTHYFELLWGNQLIYRIFWSNFDITHLCTLLLFLHLNCFWMSQFFFDTPFLWWYHWRGDLLRCQSDCKKDLSHDLRRIIRIGSYSSTVFCWFMYFLPWSIYGN